MRYWWYKVREGASIIVCKAGTWLHRWCPYRLPVCTVYKGSIHCAISAHATTSVSSLPGHRVELQPWRTCCCTQYPAWGFEQADAWWLQGWQEGNCVEQERKSRTKKRLVRLVQFVCDRSFRLFMTAHSAQTFCGAAAGARQWWLEARCWLLLRKERLRLSASTVHASGRQASCKARILIQSSAWWLWVRLRPGHPPNGSGTCDRLSQVCMINCRPVAHFEAGSSSWDGKRVQHDTLSHACVWPFRYVVTHCMFPMASWSALTVRVTVRTFYCMQCTTNAMASTSASPTRQSSQERSYKHFTTQREHRYKLAPDDTTCSCAS